MGNNRSRATSAVNIELPNHSAVATLLRAAEDTLRPDAAADWPPALLSALRIALGSKQPAWIAWGTDARFYYNDACIALLADHHPQALGAPLANVSLDWLVQFAARHNEAEKPVRVLTAASDHGPQEHHYAFTSVTIGDDTAHGMLHIGRDETHRVVRERRLATLQTMAEAIAGTQLPGQVCEQAMQVLSTANHDIAFAMLYRFDRARGVFERSGSMGLRAEHPLAPPRLSTDDALWPLMDALASPAGVQAVDPLPTPAMDDAAGAAAPWAVVKALMPADGDSFVLIAGLDALQPRDDESERFVLKLCTLIEQGLTTALTHEDMRRRIDLLAEADRSKTAFFSNVSHEFRTPLTLMLGPIEDILDASQELDDQLRDSLAIMQRNGQRLLKMVNSLLDFSRIEAGRADAAFEPVDLARSTAELASQFRAAIEKADLRFDVDCPVLPEPVYIDREMWEKIVLNLLSNAFKHTFVGEIAIRLGTDADVAVLSVRDTGIGIAQNELGKLFNRFQRVHGARSRTHEGTGIGLALVQELAKLHGGSVSVDSVIDVGSTFTVRIPFGHAHLDAAQIGARRARPLTAIGAGPYLAEAERWIAAAPATVIGGGERPRIVLADDNADMREYISRLLESDYDVVAVGDGRDALHAIVEERPALVLTDVMMPRLDGFGLLRAIRRNPRLSGIPVIVLSARAGEHASSEGLESGANDYLVKPFSARELLTRVASQLAQARARDEALLRERTLRDEAEGLNEISRELAAELHVPTLLDKISAIAIRLTGAQFGAFLRATMDGNSLPGDLDAISAAARETLDRFGLQPDSAFLAPTFRGAAPLRIDQLRDDARYQQQRAANAPGAGSFLAVPVVTRNGEVLGGLFFGHADAGAFTTRAERYAAGIAAQAAVALDNGRLYAQLRTELRERERAQRALRTSEQWYRAIGESIRYGVWISDARGRNTYASPSFLELLGISQEDYSRDGWRPVLHPDDLDAADAAWKHCVRTGGQWDRELRLRDAEGRWQYILSRGVPVYDGEGRVTGWAGINLDFTRSRRVENELRDADRRKDEFLATLAHELRNPLAPLRNGLQIMRAAPDNAALVANAREMMERQLQQMVRLVDDLLDLSRISRGKIELKHEAVEIATMLGNALETTRAVLEAGEYVVRLQLPPEPLYVNGDMTRLSQVIVNLLNNAAKYSMTGQEITVTVGSSDEQLTIAVRDHGVGIPAEMLARVFDMFTQIDRSLERSQGGLGIGLSIVKRIVELHGGNVDAHSDGTNLGSEFRISLPRTAPPAATSEVPKPLAARPDACLRVLLVDDNIDAAQSLATILQFDGCDTQIAHDGETALDLARSFLPDAVVLDIGLPQISGYEVCRQMRQQPWGRDMVIIALTGWGQDEHRRRSHEAGFDHHLVKPVDPGMLSELLLVLRKNAPADAEKRLS